MMDGKTMYISTAPNFIIGGYWPTLLRKLKTWKSKFKFARYLVMNIHLLTKCFYRNLPRGIIIALVLITMCYLFVNIAYFAGLDKSQILSSTATALVRKWSHCLVLSLISFRHLVM